MYNAAIKTAVVINDPTTFLQEFGSDPLHSLTAGYERLGSENQNIMVFIYTDKDLANIYEVREINAENKDANIINIPGPNAIELKNMLMYMKMNYGLKLRLSELTEVAVALHQALQLSEQPVRIKELYTRLLGFEKKKLLDKDNCYELLDMKKPESAKEQLNNLIGMAMVKKTLASYETKDRSPLAALPYLTASRLQPDLDNPNEKKEIRLSDDPDKLEISLFQGAVSSVQTKGGLSRINANMEAKRGCSGAPVFSKKDGTIIGILCGSQTEGDSKLVEEINYVLPVKYILENVVI